MRNKSMTRSVLLASLLLSSALHAQDLSQLERVLVPVYSTRTITGADGSIFRSAFGAFSGQTFTVTYYPAGNDEVATIEQPRMQFHIWEAPVAAKGRFLYFDKATAARPMFAQVESERPGGKRTLSPLPVVKARDARTGKSTIGWLPSIAIYDSPQNNQFLRFIGYRQRHTLRIYDFDSRGDLQVTVRVAAGTSLIFSRTIERVVDVAARDFDHITYPYYAEVNLGLLFGFEWCQPGFRTACADFWAVIEIEPSDPTARYYAFVSTTDNDTGHVSVHTPRD